MRCSFHLQSRARQLEASLRKAEEGAAKAVAEAAKAAEGEQGARKVPSKPSVPAIACFHLLCKAMSNSPC